MADNVAITAGSGTTIATDDIGGAQYQRIKIGLGADGSATDAVGGAGAVSAAVQRVTLASDDPAVALLTTMDADTGAMVTDLAAIEVLLGTIDADTGTIATNTGTTNTNLTTIIGHVDGLEGQLTTIIGHVDGIEGLLTTIDADTSTLAGAVSGSEMQVDVVAALPAGSNTIGAVTNTHLTNALIGEYETVAASQTDQVIGATGASGDYLSHLIVVPATTSPGAVQIKDGSAGSNITVFTGGASSVSNLVPFVIPVGMTSAASGGWRVTTAGNVSVIAVGNFT